MFRDSYVGTLLCNELYFYINHFGIFNDLNCLNVIIISSTNRFNNGPHNDGCQTSYLFNTHPRNKKTRKISVSRIS